MQTVDLEVAERKEKGKGPAGRLRTEGRVPAILYGGGETPLPISIDRKILERALRGSENVVVRIHVGEAETYALIRDLAIDPISRKYIHADFQRVRLEERVRARVRISFLGVAPGTKEGGILQENMREIDIEGRVLDIPAAVEVDLSGLNIGESIHAREVKLPEGIRLLADADATIATVVLPAAEEEAKPAEAAVVEGAVPAEGAAAAPGAEGAAAAPGAAGAAAKAAPGAKADAKSEKPEKKEKKDKK